jgi:hypothetical protein
MLIRRRWDLCLAVKTAVALLVSCVTTPCTMINHITSSKHTTCSKLVVIISTLLADIQADPILLAHTCSPNPSRSFHEVILPYAFDLQLPGWQKWLKETKDKLRDAYHEEMRREAVARNPLWSYELMLDRCDGSY